MKDKIKESHNLDVLEDLDLPFKPKKVRRAKGMVVKRSQAKFKTAFADDLVNQV